MTTQILTHAPTSMPTDAPPAPAVTVLAPRTAEPGISEQLGEEIQRLAEGPRLIGRVDGEHPGPTFVAVGSLHGNEPAGALGLSHLFERLTPEGLRGRVYGLVGNRQALARRRRYIQTDLNRAWTSERLERVRSADPAELADEDLEMRQLDEELQRILAEAPKPVYFLDLHTTSAPGPAFVNLDDTLANRKFALEIPLPVVVGLEEELAGTLASYLSYRQVVTVGFESGQHEEMEAVDRAEAAAWIALESAGLFGRGTRPEIQAARRELEAHGGGLPHVVEVFHRHEVRPGDGFRMDPGFESFQDIEAGQALANDHRGRITAGHDGLILMPLYQEQGADGFFLIRPVRMLWLRISATVRRLHIEKVIHWLPGVQRHDAPPGSFRIDLRVARWYALELFHLLGFRRQRLTENELLMSRRTRNGV